MKYRSAFLPILLMMALIISTPLASSKASSNKMQLNELTVTASLLTLKKGNPDQYDITLQWPLTNINQWGSIINFFTMTSKSEDQYNPILAKDPSVVTLSQKNPDMISGETVYLASSGYIMRVTKTPVDSYFDSAEELFDFLNTEIKRSDSEYTVEKKTIQVNTPGIVVIYRGSSKLGNPTWTVTDPARIEMYKSFIAKLSPIRRSNYNDFASNKENEEYTGLNSFHLYLNYPMAPGSILIVRDNGYSRLTRFKETTEFYEDKEKFYKNFLKQAADIYRTNEEIRLKQEGKDQDLDF